MSSSSIIILLIVLLYLFVCCMLVYVFFKNKPLWHSIYIYLHNNIMSIIYIINPRYIKQLFYEYFICQTHAILNLTFPDTNSKIETNAKTNAKTNANINANTNANINTNTNTDTNTDMHNCLCLLCFTELEDTNIHNTNNIYIQEITQLYNIYNLYKQIDKFNLFSLNNNLESNLENNLDNNLDNKKETEKTILISHYKMYLWLLENSIKDYEYIKNATSDIYYKLKDTFIHINTSKDTTSTILSQTMSINTPPLDIIENIVYIENNLQIYKHIIDINNIYECECENEYLPEQTKKKQEIQTINHINSYYLFALFNDIYAYIKKINILALQSII